MNKLLKFFMASFGIMMVLAGCSPNTSNTSTKITYDATKSYWLEWNADSAKEKPWMLAPRPHFTETPTEEHILHAYYWDKWEKITDGFQDNTSGDFKLLDYKRVEIDQNKYTVQVSLPFKTEQEKQFFDKYHLGLTIQIQVEGKFVQMFLDEGWKIVNTKQ